MVEPGHSSPVEYYRPGCRFFEICSDCGEILDLITGEEDQGFLEAVPVKCEVTGRQVPTRRDSDFPWDYRCPDCGLAVYRREKLER